MVLLGLARKAGDKVGGDGAVGHITTDGGHAVEIPLAGIFSVHTLQHYG